jgi:hypothetical protein
MSHVGLLSNQHDLPILVVVTQSTNETFVLRSQYGFPELQPWTYYSKNHWIWGGAKLKHSSIEAPLLGIGNWRCSKQFVS